MTGQNSLVAAMGGSIQKKQPFTAVISSTGYQNMLQAAIQDTKTRQTFVTALTAAVTANPLLANSDPKSIVSAGLQVVALGLSPSPSMGEAWLIPYGDKCNMQLGFKGLLKMAIRTGFYVDVDAIEVRDGEYKGRDKRNGKPTFEFVESDDEALSKPIAGYLASFEMTNGFTKTVYMTKQEVMNHAKRYSKAFDSALFGKYETYLSTGEGMTADELRKCSSPWYSNFDQMAKKTVLIRLFKRWGFMSTEMQEAFDSDEKTENPVANVFDVGTVDVPSVGTTGAEEKQEERESVYEDVVDGTPKVKKNTKKNAAEEIF